MNTDFITGGKNHFTGTFPNPIGWIPLALALGRALIDKSPSLEAKIRSDAYTLPEMRSNQDRVSPAPPALQAGEKVRLPAAPVFALPPMAAASPPPEHGIAVQNSFAARAG